MIPLALLSLSGGTAAGRDPGSGTKRGEHPGEADDAEIVIERGASQTTVHGALGTARSESASGSHVEKWIGCWIDAASPGGAMVTCQAHAADGDEVQCSSIEPQMVAAAYSINGDSKVTFIIDNVANDSGDCRHIEVENVSFYNVKSP